MNINKNQKKRYYLRYYGDNILSKKSKSVSLRELNKLQDLIDSMNAIMNKKNGIGISAPQVGINKKIIIINKKIIEQEYGSLIDNNIDTYNSNIIMINPKIKLIDNEQIIAEEGCISIPNLFAHISRYNKIEIDFMNYITNQNITTKLLGIASIIVQHEIDHLNGILFVERLQKLQYDKIKKALYNIKTKYNKI